MKLSKKFLLGSAIAAGCVVFGTGDADASSHREAPFITRHPKVDSTDFYMFMSEDTPGYVTILANYQPFQENFGGPNYYELDPDALYEIHVDNTGDGKEDVTFQFNFHHTLANNGNGINLSTFTGAGGTGQGANPGSNPIPLINAGPISAANPTGNLNVIETYDLTVVAGDRRTGVSTPAFTGQGKPVDFIGTTTFGSVAGYEAYAKSFQKTFDASKISNVAGCTGNATAWVGQRREPFAGNIGIIFDLLQSPNAGAILEGGAHAAGRGYNAANPFDTGLLYNKSVTTLALQVPAACLTGDPNSTSPAKGIIGGWTSASLHQARVLNPAANYTVPSKEGGAWTQVSHLGMPLVNEVVIGLKDKDTFSAVSPVDTSKVAGYVTNPTLPALIEILYGSVDPNVKAPVATRVDLVGVFATGLTVKNATPGAASPQLVLTQTNTGGGIQDPTGGTLPQGIWEYLRLNTNVPATSQANQQTGDFAGLGALGCLKDDPDTTAPVREADLSQTSCDPAGFPNGRRPQDDVLDIALRVVMGAAFNSDQIAPARNIAFTDHNYNGPEQFNYTFPYLRTPLAGNVDPNVSADSLPAEDQ